MNVCLLKKKVFKPYLIYSVPLQKLHNSNIELEKDMGQSKIYIFFKKLFSSINLGPFEIIISLIITANAHIHLCVRC